VGVRSVDASSNSLSQDLLRARASCGAALAASRTYCLYRPRAAFAARNVLRYARCDSCRASAPRPAQSSAVYQHFFIPSRTRIKATPRRARRPRVAHIARSVAPSPYAAHTRSINDCARARCAHSRFALRACTATLYACVLPRHAAKALARLAAAASPACWRVA